uniref:Uncharacterized protein n=1 Tax=Nelumbo nucifera TaxID=4432 RepID=A0A822XQD7_NELNU|nr:TPA_asm: hypothetical protein HUJ06_022619 [Nelumbo nucifera]
MGNIPFNISRTRNQGKWVLGFPKADGLLNALVLLMLCGVPIWVPSEKHNHDIHILPSIEGPHYGLISVGMPTAKTITIGLQWDLSNSRSINFH